MVCLYCGSETQVTNSRPQKRSNSIWRRRQCLACKSIFSTEEHLDYEKSIVVQYTSSGAQASRPFLRDKLFASIYRSIQHRPEALHDTIGLTQTAMTKLWQRTQNGRLDAVVIAEVTLGILSNFDKPAAISYRAYHPDIL